MLGVFVEYLFVGFIVRVVLICVMIFYDIIV